MGDNGPTVSLAGGQNLACAGIMVLFGPADAVEAPVEADVAVGRGRCGRRYP